MKMDKTLFQNMDRTAAPNRTFSIGRVSCTADTFVVNQTLVFHPDIVRDKFCGKSNALRVPAKHYEASQYLHHQYYQV